MPIEDLLKMVGPVSEEDPIHKEIIKCVGCGLCLPHCPTYREVGTEMASPRGRITLAKEYFDGKLKITERFAEHLYLCLECLACETACPSGVKFHRIMEPARNDIEKSLERPFPEKLIRDIVFKEIFPYPKRLQLLFGLLRLYQVSGIQWLVRKTGLLSWISESLEKIEQMLPSVSSKNLRQSLKEVTPPLGGSKRYRVGFLSGCVMNLCFASINLSTVRVLARNGCEVVTPRFQKCCGALHMHNGVEETARQMARYNIDVFEKSQLEAIIVNSAGCGSALKEYGELLKDDPKYAEKAHAFSEKVRDVSEFLVQIDFAKPRIGLQKKVAYDDPCHLLHGQGVKFQPREILRAIPGLNLIEFRESDWCCGSAGIYNITHNDLSMRLLDRKMAHIKITGADLIATANPGCILQLQTGVKRAGLDMDVVHVVELLDQAYLSENRS
jgi:glycolate oxidase iron-sulfur subunit